LIDLILTNVPHKFSSSDVFCGDLSDHCVVAALGNTKMPKLKSRIIYERTLKPFNEQACHHDLSNFDWKKIGLLPDVEYNIYERNLAWAKARKTGSPIDWFVFRQLQNKCSSFIKKAKSEYYLT